MNRKQLNYIKYIAGGALTLYLVLFVLMYSEPNVSALTSQGREGGYYYVGMDRISTHCAYADDENEHYMLYAHIGLRLYQDQQMVNWVPDLISELDYFEINLTVEYGNVFATVGVKKISERVYIDLDDEITLHAIQEENDIRIPVAEIEYSMLGIDNPVIKDVNGTITTYLEVSDGIETSFICSGEFNVQHLYFGGTTFFKSILIILAVGFILTFIILLNKRHNTDVLNKSRAQAEELKEEGFLPIFREIGEVKVYAMEAEKEKKKREKEATIRRHKNEDVDFLDQISDRKQRISIPGYYDSNLTFNRYIFHVAVIFAGLMASIAGLINYFMRQPVMTQFPFLFIVYVGIAGIAVVVLISMLIALPLTKAPKIGIDDIEKVVTSLDTGEEQKSAFSTEVIEHLDETRAKTEYKIADYTVVKIINAAVMIGTVVFCMFDLQMFTADYYKTIFGPVDFLTLITDFNLIITSIQTHVPEILLLFMMIVILGMTLKSSFIKQYSIIANIAILVTLYQGFHIMGIATPTWLIFPIIWGACYFLFAVLIVPRQNSPSHAYQSLISDKSTWHSNTILYLSERIHSQRGYIYAGVLLSLLLIEPFTTEFSPSHLRFIVINVAPFIIALFIDSFFFYTRKKTHHSFNKGKLMSIIMIILFMLTCLDIYMIYTYRNQFFMVNFCCELFLGMKILFGLSGDKKKAVESMSVITEQKPNKLTEKWLFKIDLLFYPHNYEKYDKETRGIWGCLDNLGEKNPLFSGVLGIQFLGKIMDFVRKFMLIEVCAIFEIWLGFFSSYLAGDVVSVLNEMTISIGLTLVFVVIGLYFKKSGGYHYKFSIDLILLLFIIPMGTVIWWLYCILTIIVFIELVITILVFSLVKSTGIEAVNAILSAGKNNVGNPVASVLEMLSYMLSFAGILGLCSAMNIIAGYITQSLTDLIYIVSVVCLVLHIFTSELLKKDKKELHAVHFAAIIISAVISWILVKSSAPLVLMQGHSVDLTRFVYILYIVQGLLGLLSFIISKLKSITKKRIFPEYQQGQEPTISDPQDQQSTLNYAIVSATDSATDYTSQFGKELGLALGQAVALLKESGAKPLDEFLVSLKASIKSFLKNPNFQVPLKERLESLGIDGSLLNKVGDIQPILNQLQQINAVEVNNV
ncbi:MAG: hypothetical protein GF364_03320 [Candidatus Lokiarchaeota archaeon]|nr:hypothetical protein [Candidatus Lokiarchaeota archaeon]